MANLGYHICLHLEDNRVIAATPRERRILARLVLRQGRRDDLYAFSCPDNHLHIASRCGRGSAGRLAHRIGSGLRQRLRLPVGFVQYPPKPIADNRHLYSAVRYILRQHEHHGLPRDPRGEGSSISDLLGLRVVGRYTADNIQRWLPRLRSQELLELSGLPKLQPANATPNEETLREALLAAGCRVDLTGTSRELIALRVAAVAVIGHQVPRETLADVLGIHTRTLCRLRARPHDPALAHAIRLQFCLSNQASTRLPPPVA